MRRNSSKIVLRWRYLALSSPVQRWTKYCRERVGLRTRLGAVVRRWSSRTLTVVCYCPSAFLCRLPAASITKARAPGVAQLMCASSFQVAWDEWRLTIEEESRLAWVSAKAAKRWLRTALAAALLTWALSLSESRRVTVYACARERGCV